MEPNILGAPSPISIPLPNTRDHRVAFPGATEQGFSLQTSAKRCCSCYDFYNRLIPYKDAWNWQKALVSSYGDSIGRGASETQDTVMLLQHPPVYTMGTRSSSEFLKFDKDDPPIELHVTERGGEVTYHGPGQLVMYPIINLRGYKMDLHWYLRSLEEVVIRALWSAYSLKASRVPGLTGVWIGDEKVAAIGVRVSKWITYHGLALNVTTDLTPFNSIVPCGISDKSVGNIAKLVEGEADILDRVHSCLLDAFSEIFNVELVKFTELKLKPEDDELKDFHLS